MKLLRPDIKQLIYTNVQGTRYIPFSSAWFEANLRRTLDPNLAKAAFVGANTVKPSPRIKVKCVTLFSLCIQSLFLVCVFSPCFQWGLC